MNLLGCNSPEVLFLRFWHHAYKPTKSFLLFLFYLFVFLPLLLASYGLLIISWLLILWHIHNKHIHIILSSISWLADLSHWLNLYIWLNRLFHILIYYDYLFLFLILLFCLVNDRLLFVQFHIYLQSFCILHSFDLIILRDLIWCQYIWLKTNWSHHVLVHKVILFTHMVVDERWSLKLNRR